MHDLPLYPQFPGGYDHVLVPSVLGLKTRCEHLATRVELRTLTSVFVGGLLDGWRASVRRLVLSTAANLGCRARLPSGISPEIGIDREVPAVDVSQPVGSL
jgi:hypothetical protein